MIVIDASALVKYLLHESGWEKVSFYVRNMKPLYSVDHVLKETLNALWKYSYTFNMIEKSHAILLYRKLLKVIEKGVIVIEHENNYLDKALEISLNEGITIYDSLYIAQALKYGELLTSDSMQAKKAEKYRIEVHLA